MASFSSYIVAHPSIYLAAAPLIALTALSTTPSFLPMVVLLVTLRLHVYTFLPRGKAASHGLSQVLLLSLATLITHIAASMHALSTGSALSITVLGCLSALTAAVSLATISLGYYVNRTVHTPWAKLTLFPAIWASVWGTVEYLSPVGRLITWSPVVGLGPYSWIRPILGQWGIDWIVAAWAVVGADLIGHLLVGSASTDLEDASSEQRHLIYITSDDPQEHILAQRSRSQSSSPRSGHTRSLVGLLIALILPSFFTSSLPLPVVPSLDTTSVTVGCALPDMRRSGVLTGTPTLKDFMSASHQLENRADIILWPEGAVRFESTTEKEATFRQISSSMPAKKLYGISFEDFSLRDSNEGTQKEGMRRNGFVLIGMQGPVLEYYKRNLVPIAESFSLTPSFDPPSIYTMEVEAPKNWNKTAWAPSGNHTRPISLTASICLDFSTSSTFAGLESRPALILAPARTWHIDVGYAMWEQARARAEELGSTVVWCDGGAGGVSGVAGRGMHEIMQVGQGSWTKQIGVERPFDQSRTLFSRGGGFAALATVWGIVGVGSVAEMLLLGLRGDDVRSRVVACFTNMVSTLRLRKKTDEERSLLE